MFDCTHFFFFFFFFFFFNLDPLFLQNVSTCIYKYCDGWTQTYIEATEEDCPIENDDCNIEVDDCSGLSLHFPLERPSLSYTEIEKDFIVCIVLLTVIFLALMSRPTQPNPNAQMLLPVSCLMGLLILH